MSGCEHVNFIPKNLRQGFKLELQELVILSWILAVVIMLGLGGFELHAANTIKDQIEEIESKAKQITASAEQIAIKAKSASESSRRISSAKEFLKARITWTELLKELSLLTPGTVWISSLSTKIEKDQLSLAIIGEAPSQIHVAAILLALESSYFFHDVSMNSSERLVDFAPDLFRFEFQIPVPQFKERGEIAKAK